MSSTESSTGYWKSIAPEQLIEVGLVRIEISYPSRLFAAYSDQDMVKEFVRNSLQTVAEALGGKFFSWAGDGGAFMFLIRDNDSFDNCALAAIQMLEMVPALNQDIRSSTDLDDPVAVSIACDSGMVKYQPGPGHRAEDFVRKLMKLHVDTENRVTITERIYRQLTKQLKARFVSWNRSVELEIDLYATPPLQGGGQASGVMVPGREILMEEKRPAPPIIPPAQAPTMPAAKRLHGYLRHAASWQMFAAVLFFLATVFIIWNVYISSFPSPLPAQPELPVWNEPVQKEEWKAWRNQVHAKLASVPVDEKSLIEALEIKRPTVRTPPAAALRQDQALADVLLSYRGVPELLRNKLGINDRFLGTGFSNPVNALDYGSASVHEYFIPNLPDDRPHVLTLIFNPSTTLDMDKKVKDLIEEHAEQNETTQKLKKAISVLADAKKPGTVVIRFALFPKDFYKNTVGPPGRVRTFASDLTEVWNLTVKDAADRSGYGFTSGKRDDAFFVWVLVPRHAEEAVPATWGNVLEHLPKWLNEAASKGS